MAGDIIKFLNKCLRLRQEWCEIGGPTVTGGHY